MESSTEVNLDKIVGETENILHAKPKISPTLAAELLRNLYGLDATEIKEMNSFLDRNFHVKVSLQHRNPHINRIHESGYTLKIINTGKSAIEGHFDSMHTAVQQLEKKGLRVPVAVKNLEGRTFSLHRVPLMKEDTTGLKKCGVYLYTYIPGVPLPTIDVKIENIFEWGVLLAKFHTALEDLDCPNLKTKINVGNLKYFPMIDNYTETLDDTAKKLVGDVLQRYPAEVPEIIENLKEGFIHGDLNEHNILARMLEPAGCGYVADGMLDFEDIHYGHYVWDIGVMLAQTTLVAGTPGAVAAMGHALAGYRSARMLSREEMLALKICAECRLCQTLVFCSHASKLDPDNAYISSLNLTDVKCAALELLSNTPVEDLLHQWNAIYASYNSSKNANM